VTRTTCSLLLQPAPEDVQTVQPAPAPVVQLLLQLLQLRLNMKLVLLQLALLSLASASPPLPKGLPAHTDCAVRKLAYEYGLKQLSLDALPALHDALELPARCGTAPIAERAPRHTAPSFAVDAATKLYVDYAAGSDSAAGTFAAPLKTVQKAVAVARGKPKPAAIVLRGGTHYATETVRLGAADSGLTLVNYAGETAWLSGAHPLMKLEWKPDKARQAQSINAWVADVSSVDAAVLGAARGLRVNGSRGTPARYPNANMELDQFPVGWLAPSTELDHWLPRNATGKTHQITVRSPNRTGALNFVNYKVGINGSCAHFTPQVSFWCASKTGGGGASPYTLPGGLTFNTGDREKKNGSSAWSHIKASRWKNPVAGGAEIAVWRPGHWSSWFFEMAGFDEDSATVVFGKGGFQGSRGNRKGAEFFFSHIFEELDAANEFFLDRASKILYYVHNASLGVKPPANGFAFPLAEKILHIEGEGGEVMTQTASNISVLGLGFRDAVATYLAPHGVPSGGDWGMQRSAALFLQNSAGVNINAIILSGHNAHTSIAKNEIRWTGDSAIAAWGFTDELGNGGQNGIDGTKDAHPQNTLVANNLIHELGVFEKQSSMFFQAKTARSTLRNNVFFNGPRAGVNFNDGFGGGSLVTENLIFNTCRESGDHGPFNSWDRQPFRTVNPATGKASLAPAVNLIKRNFIFADYSGVKALDHDDGSSYYDDSENVIFMGWMHKNFVPSPGRKHTFNSLGLFAAWG